MSWNHLHQRVELIERVARLDRELGHDDLGVLLRKALTCAVVEALCPKPPAPADTPELLAPTPEVALEHSAPAQVLEVAEVPPVAQLPAPCLEADPGPAEDAEEDEEAVPDALPSRPRPSRMGARQRSEQERENRRAAWGEWGGLPQTCVELLRVVHRLGQPRTPEVIREASDTGLTAASLRTYLRELRMVGWVESPVQGRWQVTDAVGQHLFDDLPPHLREVYAFIQTRGEVQAADLISHLGLHRQRASNLLHHLHRGGLLARPERGLYTLTPRVPVEDMEPRELPESAPPEAHPDVVPEAAAAPNHLDDGPEATPTPEADPTPEDPIEHQDDHDDTPPQLDQPTEAVGQEVAAEAVEVLEDFAVDAEQDDDHTPEGEPMMVPVAVVEATPGVPCVEGVDVLTGPREQILCALERAQEPLRLSALAGACGSTVKALTPALNELVIEGSVRALGGRYTLSSRDIEGDEREVWSAEKRLGGKVIAKAVTTPQGWRVTWPPALARRLDGRLLDTIYAVRMEAETTKTEAS